MMNTPDFERDQAIKTMRENGATLRAIAEQYGISVERTRQIILRVDREYGVRVGGLLLPTLCGHCLLREGISTEAGMRSLSRKQAQGIPNFGKKCWEQLQAALKTADER